MRLSELADYLAPFVNRLDEDGFDPFVIFLDEESNVYESAEGETAKETIELDEQEKYLALKLLFGLPVDADYEVNFK